MRQHRADRIYKPYDLYVSTMFVKASPPVMVLEATTLLSRSVTNLNVGSNVTRCCVKSVSSEASASTYAIFSFGMWRMFISSQRLTTLHGVHRDAPKYKTGRHALCRLQQNKHMGVLRNGHYTAMWTCDLS